MSLRNSLSDSKTANPVVCLGDANANSHTIVSPIDKNGSCETEKSRNTPAPEELGACADPKIDFKISVETMIVKRLLQKAKQSYDSHKKPHEQQHQAGGTVKKKLRRRYKSSKKKSKNQSETQPTSEYAEVTNAEVHSSSVSLRSIIDASHLKPLTIEVENMTVPNQNVSLIAQADNAAASSLQKRHSMVLGRKKFTLPIVSARSSRKIFPRKRYLQEEELEVPSKKNLPSNVGNSKRKKKGQKGSPLDQSLLVESEHNWKPNVKLKLAEKGSPHMPLAPQRENRNSGVHPNLPSAASSSDFIKPDMVSKYADKMAEKPKERRLKNGDGRKSLLRKTNDSLVVRKLEPSVPEKKNMDPLERIAAKIEKILKSQWEGRLNNQASSLPSPKPENTQTMKVKTSPLSQWKSEQEQRACDRKRTKNLIRKAKLQLKKRTLMKLRQPQSIAFLNEQLQQDASKTGPFSDKQRSLCSPSGVDWPAVPIELKQSPVPPKFDVPGAKACCVCGCSATVHQVQKYYGQLACDACSKFFGNFIETPKQYFCSRDGCCRSCVKATRNKTPNSRFRCKACWLKSCMQDFSVSSFLRDQLLKYVPRLEAPPHGPLIDDGSALLKLSNVVNFTPIASTSNHSLDPEVTVVDNFPILVSNSTPSDQSVHDAGPIYAELTAVKLLPEVTNDEHCKTTGLLTPVVNEDTFPMPYSSFQETDRALGVKVVELVAVKAPFVDGMKHPVELPKEKLVAEVPNSSPEKKATVVLKRDILDDLDDPKKISIPIADVKKPRGPRIKHVCRRAAVVLGLPRATFPKQGPKKLFNLSALPRDEKHKVLASEIDVLLLSS